MSSWEVSAEVAELIGAENLRLLAARAASGYTCSVCRQQAASLDDPASVVVFRDATLTAVKLAHTRCSGSRVVEVAPGSLQTTNEAPALAVAGVLPSAGELGMRPVLIVELGAIDVGGGGDRVDGVVTALIERGLHLVDRVGRTAPVVEGWAVTLIGADVRAEGPDMRVYEGQAWRPDGWEQLVSALGGRCELFIGVGLRLTEGLGDAVEGIRRLQEASRAGLLVGGTVRCRR